MHSEYYKGCQITLQYGDEAHELLLKVRKRVEAEYEGAEIIIDGGASKMKVEAGGVFVPDAHPLSSAGEVDASGQLVRPMGGEMILRRVMNIIEEEEKT